MTKLVLGSILLISGGAVSAGGFMLNSDSPLQVGPIPVLGGAFVSLVGLILVISNI